VTTTNETGLNAATDEEHLAFARDEGRVVVTHDSDFLRLHNQGVPHAGIVYCHLRERTIGQLLRALTRVSRCRTPEDMRGRVEFV